jgi:hypothetical protein
MRTVESLLDHVLVLKLFRINLPAYIYILGTDSHELRF